MNEYILFYNYANGTRTYGFYSDYDELKEAYDDAIADSKKFGSDVEIGFAEILHVTQVNWVE